MRPLLLCLAFLLMPATAFAYINVTYITTTVYLSNSTTAHVVEQINLYVSNSSVAQYQQYRTAISQTLSGWQSALGTSLLVQHILNPKSSISNFTLLPGPISQSGNGGIAQLTMDYYANNVTSVVSVSPRRFLYTFNASAFNFQHTASGQALFPNSKLQITIPSGAQALQSSIYPLPDYPTGNYANVTQFSWYQSEPLNKFSFSYVITKSLQQEVVQFFTGVYNSNRIIIYLVVIAVLAAALLYTYFKIIV